MGKSSRLLIGLGYLALLVAVPTGTLLWRAFDDGLGTFWSSITTPDARHALWLTLLLVGIAVPLNTIFGILAALWLSRHRGAAGTIVGVLIDVPLALSPVVAGLAIVLVWGLTGWFGAWMIAHGIRVIYAIPGMILATVLVTLPFVAREVLPVLKELGTDQQEAAHVLGATRWQTFRRITFPAIRPAVAYGVVLTTARALGEYGAVAVTSGRLGGQTETLTLEIENRFLTFDLRGAYAAAVVLAFLSVLTVAALSFTNREESH